MRLSGFALVDYVAQRELRGESSTITWSGSRCDAEDFCAKVEARVAYLKGDRPAVDLTEWFRVGDELR